MLGTNATFPEMGIWSVKFCRVFKRCSWLLMQFHAGLAIENNKPTLTWRSCWVRSMYRNRGTRQDPGAYQGSLRTVWRKCPKTVTIWDWLHRHVHKEEGSWTGEGQETVIWWLKEIGSQMRAEKKNQKQSVSRFPFHALACLQGFSLLQV